MEDVISFCDANQVEVPNMEGPYFVWNGRHKKQDGDMEHHYKIEIFYSAIDLQLSELNRRFNVEAVELLILSSDLDPKENFKSFDNQKICKLVEKFFMQMIFLSWKKRIYHFS